MSTSEHPIVQVASLDLDVRLPHSTSAGDAVALAAVLVRYLREEVGCWDPHARVVHSPEEVAVCLSGVDGSGDLTGVVGRVHGVSEAFLRDLT